MAEADILVHSPLHSALHDEEITKLLPEHGADANIGHHIYPPLASAARTTEAIVTLLLDYGADPNLVGREDSNWGIIVSGLCWAVHWGNAPMTKLLLERGADWRHAVHQSVLHNAAAHGRTEVIGVLLDCGVGVNGSIPPGLTALQYAIANGHAEAAELLRSRGARM